MAEGNGLLNRRRGIYLYRGFESRPLRSSPVIAVFVPVTGVFSRVTPTSKVPPSCPDVFMFLDGSSGFLYKIGLSYAEIEMTARTI